MDLFSDNSQEETLYCPTCGEPLYHTAIFLGKTFRFRQLCKCESAAREQKIAEQNARDEYRAMRIRQEASFGSLGYRKYTFQNDLGYNENAMQFAKQYVDQFDTFLREGSGLLIFGDVGTGKSFIAGCIANELNARNKAVYMDSIPKLLSKLSGAFPEDRTEMLNIMTSVKLLILDDLGTESGTPTQMSNLFMIIDERYKSHLPMVITTNLTLDELQRPDTYEKERIYSRILECCTPVLINSTNVRKEIEQRNLEMFRTSFRTNDNMV